MTDIANLLVVLAFNAIVLLVSLYVFKQRLERRLKSDQLTSTISAEVNVLITELNSTTERNITLIEDKILTLKRQIDRAELTLARLSQRRSETVELKATTYSRPLPRPNAVKGEVDGADLGQEGGNAPSSITRQEEAPPVDSRTVRDRVLKLHVEGVELSVIASRVGISLSEVELIVSLGTMPGASRVGVAD